MIDSRKETLRQTVLLYVTGIYLIGLVFLVPHSGYREGRSFFVVASSSPWERWWDWPAAWCSIKIILLSLGVALVTLSLALFARILHRKKLARFFLLLMTAPGLGFWAGMFLLVKALL